MHVSRKFSVRDTPKIFGGGISVIGMGRWGSALCAALTDCGIGPEELVGRFSRKTSRGRITQIVGLDRAVLDAEVLWLCVPDSEIAGVASAIVARRASLRGQVIVHSSGVFSSAVLAEAKQAGGKVASVHPLMSFPTRKAVALSGVPFAIEATGALTARLEKLVVQLGGRPFHLPAAGKALYHAAAVMASPLLVSLASAARTTAVQAGLTDEQADTLLEPIMTATVRNFFRDGGAQSFSGPFARGDAGTVSLHLDALQAHHLLQAVYTALAEHAIDELPVMNKRSLQRALSTAKTNILK